MDKNASIFEKFSFSVISGQNLTGEILMRLNWNNDDFFHFVVLGNRPSSQMSFLEQFLQESSEQGRSRDPINAGRSESSVERKTTGASTLSHGSIESDEPDQDTDVDNQIASVASSRSNMSETSERISPASRSEHHRMLGPPPLPPRPSA